LTRLSCWNLGTKENHRSPKKKSKQTPSPISSPSLQKTEESDTSAPLDEELLQMELPMDHLPHQISMNYHTVPQMMDVHPLTTTIEMSEEQLNQQQRLLQQQQLPDEDSNSRQKRVGKRTAIDILMEDIPDLFQKRHNIVIQIDNSHRQQLFKICKKFSEDRAIAILKAILKIIRSKSTGFVTPSGFLMRLLQNGYEGHPSSVIPLHPQIEIALEKLLQVAASNSLLGELPEPLIDNDHRRLLSVLPYEQARDLVEKVLPIVRTSTGVKVSISSFFDLLVHLIAIQGLFELSSISLLQISSTASTEERRLRP
jgi:hypothetical protein